MSAAGPRAAGPPAVLVDPQIYDLLNVGGAAMTQGLAARLRGRWPGVELLVLTEAPDRLETLIPGAVPVPHRHLERWTADRYLLAPLHRVLPDRVARRVIDAQRGTERRYPRMARAVTRARIGVRGDDAREFRAFRAAMDRAALVVVSGGSGPSDAFPATLRGTLATLDLAHALGIPTAMVSQGAGELRSGSARARVEATLAGVRQVLVRERAAAPARFAAWGVPPERLAFGADDALPLVLAAVRDRPGDGLGVNLRLAAYTALGPETVGVVRDVVGRFVARTGARPVPVPIAVHGRANDPAAIRALLADVDPTSDGGDGVRTPADAIAAAGRCRVVLTGAYHAAVFALAQGVPVVAVATSAMYLGKFGGLVAEWGDACRVVRADGQDFPQALAAALDRAWAAAPAWRGTALAVARQLAAEGDAAFARVAALGPGAPAAPVAARGHRR